jgi:hypothetical protein
MLPKVRRMRTRQVLPLLIIVGACDPGSRTGVDAPDASAPALADAGIADAALTDAALADAALTDAALADAAFADAALPDASPTGEQVTHVPVAADVAVIYASLGSGPAADHNFGGQDTVDIGEYQLTSEGLFAYALTAAGVPPGATVSKAELVIPGTYIPGGSMVTLRLGRIAASSTWSESTVTWNSRPSYEPLGQVTLTASVENRLDVTVPVAAAVAASAAEIGFALQPSSAPTIDNVFIDAKEKSGGQPTWLEVHWSH